MSEAFLTEDESIKNYFAVPIMGFKILKLIFNSNVRIIFNFVTNMARLVTK